MNNNALIKLTEERITDNNKLQSFVEKAKALTNPIFPETVQFSDSSIQYGAALVTVDTQLDQYGSNRDIYKNESGGFCLHLSKINEIAQQTGIQIIDSRIMERKVDESGKVVFISHQVKGKLKSVDGSIKEDVATGKYDYFRDKEKYRKRDGSEITGMINSRRSHAEALAESNAKTRLFNKMVAKLPSSFTIDELKKPFLIPYVLEDKEEILKQLPEADRLEIRKKLAMKKLGLMDTIYSPPEAKQIIGTTPQAPEEKSNINDSNIKDAVFTETQTDINKEDEIKILADEFRNVPQPARTDQILKLVESKNYTDPKGIAITASRIEKQSIDNQIAFLRRLMSLEVVNDEEEL